MLDFYFIRHAESEQNNHPHIIAGRTPLTPLSSQGVIQAEFLRDRFIREKVRFDSLYYSPFVRTRQTTTILADGLKIPLEKRIESPQIIELSQGNWEGRLRQEVYTPEVLAHINSDNWRFKAPNGESQQDVEKRMVEWVQEKFLSKYQENKKETTAVVSHGMAIKCLLRGIMDFSPSLTYKIVLDNTSITRLKYSPRGWHLVTVNDTAHLQGMEKLPDLYAR